MATLHAHRGLHIEVFLRRVEFNDEPLSAAENDRGVQRSLEVGPANWRDIGDVQTLQHLDAKIEIEMRFDDRRSDDPMRSTGELANHGCHAESSHDEQRIVLAGVSAPVTSRMGPHNSTHNHTTRHPAAVKGGLVERWVVPRAVRVAKQPLSRRIFLDIRPAFGRGHRNLSAVSREAPQRSIKSTQIGLRFRWGLHALQQRQCAETQ